ncbi:MAG: hypothetical protein AB1486_06080, partial [Planctomycetota bacterium]
MRTDTIVHSGRGGYRFAARLVGWVILALLVAGPARAATVEVYGHITEDTTWTSDNVYLVTEDVTVDPGVTLTIEGGVVVKFRWTSDDFSKRRLMVNGTLELVGTSGNEVV